MAEDAPTRIVIQDPSPAGGDGQLHTRRRVGDRVLVEADIFSDGSDLLRAVVLYHPGEMGRPHRKRHLWREAEMRPIDDDLDGIRWAGSFEVDRVGTWTYTIEAWSDAFGTWREALARTVEAGQRDLGGEMSEGLVLLREATDVAEVEGDRAIIEHARFALQDSTIPESAKVDFALAPELFAAVLNTQPRHDSVVLEKPLRIEVER
jgi:starch synthase (maltosyl-transferring)